MIEDTSPDDHDMPVKQLRLLRRSDHKFVEGELAERKKLATLQTSDSEFSIKGRWQEIGGSRKIENASVSTWGISQFEDRMKNGRAFRFQICLDFSLGFLALSPRVPFV